MSTLTNQKTAILLMAYGSPTRVTDVRAYFTHIRGGKSPSEALIAEVEQRYALVGGKTPLFEITKKQQEALQERLNKNFPEKYQVFVGMKHWHPFIKDALTMVKNQGFKKLIAITLAPHYSQMSIGGYRHAVDAACRELRYQPQLQFVDHWHLESYFIASIVDQLKQTLCDVPSHKQMVVFTAHSLPESIRMDSDPYEQQLLETSVAVAHLANLKSWKFSFQSAGHTSEPWLGPDIVDVIRDEAVNGMRHIIVCPIGFVSDNLEILYDLDIEAKEVADNAGVTLHRVPSRNIHPLFIEALSTLVTRLR